MYKNGEYLKKMIMEQNRHLFIYGYNSKDRSEFLQKFEKNYPFASDLSVPVALYFDNFGLPQIDVNFNEKDNYIFQTMSHEYLSFLVAGKILEKTIELDNTDLDNRLSRLIYLTNINRNKNYIEINSVASLLAEFKISRDFYYESYVNGLVEDISIDDIAIPFLNLEMFVSQYKRCMNMQSYFGIIFDKKCDMSISSIQAINNLIGARINSDISIKVVTEPDGWKTYCDVNGKYIENIHDYGIIQLDNSYTIYTKKLMK